MSTSDGGRWRGVREGSASILVQLVLLAAFLWTPLSRYGEVHYSSADLTQAMSLTRIEPGHRPGNQLQSDAVTQMQPWALFNRAELSEGRFPLWNPLNGTGTPHFANYQSAVLSPFNVPFYVLDFKAALLVSAALKLLVLGLFTYLFLREIGLGWLAATFGAVAFQFAGHNVLLLYFPHVGALCALPAGLFCAERALRRTGLALAGGGRAQLAAPLAGLTLSLVVGFLAGNPEPFYFACWAIGAWLVTRVAGLWREHRASSDARQELLRASGKLVLAILLALGLSAFQVLPFLEYLASSRVMEERSLRQTPLDPRWWPLLVFPDALGNPSSIYRISDSIPPPNYELVNMSYTGALVLLLAGLCPLAARGIRGRFFFPVFALVWFVYAHDIGGAYDLFALVPTLDLAPMNRSQGVWNFVVAAAAAAALDGLLRRAGPRAWFAAGWWCVAAGIGLVAALIGATRLIDAFQHLPSPFHRWFLQAVPPHVAAMAWWTIAGVVAIAGILVLHGRLARAALAALATVAAFAQTGWLLADYNPTSPDAYVFPRTDRVVALAAELNGERVAILGRDGLPPDSNMVYGIAQLASYDGMWVRRLDHLHRDHFGDSDNWRPILRGSHRSLRLFGTRYVLAKWDWNFLDSGLRDFQKDVTREPQRVELLPQRSATQTFRCYEPNLDVVMVQLSTPRSVRDCVLEFRLEDAETGELLVARSLTSAEVQSTVHSGKHVAFPGDWRLDPPGRPVVFRFPPIKGSQNRDFRIVLSCEDGRGGDTITAWSMPVLGYALGVARHGQRRLPGELLFDWSCGDSLRFEHVRELGDYTLLRLRDPVPVHAMARGSVVTDGPEQAFALVRSPTFDPRRLVVLDAEDPQTRHSVVEAQAAARRRTILQFAGSDWCYLVSEDGRRIAHIDDEATFLANRFEWSQIRRVPAEDKAQYEEVPDSDPEGKRAVGLILVSAPEGGDLPPVVLEETPIRTRLSVARQRPGYLVIAKAYDPGWKARLAGREVPVLRANYAFQAVEIPPGTWEVELEYLPDTLVRGLWIGAGSLLVALGALLAARRSARQGPA
ncbi:MAG: YfhO family protein [Planctomycetes bacterium]|nr:YfhO family protein [Planctomycetota bacterium]